MTDPEVGLTEAERKGLWTSEAVEAVVAARLAERDAAWVAALEDQRGRGQDYEYGIDAADFPATLSSDATAALDTVREQAKAEALREAADYCTPGKWTGPAATLIHLEHWLRVTADRHAARASDATESLDTAKWPARWCRWCQAQPGQPCITRTGEPATRPHKDRHHDRAAVEDV